MLIKKYPDGKMLIGIMSDGHRTNYTEDKTPIGTVQLCKSDSSATSPAYTLVTVPTGSTFTSQVINTPGGFNSPDEVFTITCEVYTDNANVKFKLISQTKDRSTNIVSEIEYGYIFPTGSTADLTNFEKVATFKVKADFDISGGALLNIIDPMGTKINSFYITSSLNINTNYDASSTSIQASKDVLVELDTVSNELYKTINDLDDTVSDLSSESAAKFVSR